MRYAEFGVRNEHTALRIPHSALFFWQPQGDLNPCLQAENLTSWAGLDDGAIP